MRKIKDIEFSRADSGGMDGRPSSGDQVQDGNKSHHRAADINRHLHHIRPNYRGHAALEGIDQRQHGDDGDRHNIVGGPNRNSYDDGNCEDAHALGGGAGQEKKSGGERAQAATEAMLHELVGGHHASGKIFWYENDADQHPRNEVSKNQLQESEVGIVGEAGDADDGQRAGLGGHNRERNRRPWNVLVGQEIIA